MKKCSGKSNIEIVRSYLEGNRPFVQVGYLPPAPDVHKDGDVWTDKNGKEWIQIGASKISKTLHDTKESTRQICSSCNKDIFWSNSSYDEKLFLKTGKCYDCIIEEETKMRINGTYEIYEKIKVIRNQKSFLIELKQKIEESIDWLTTKNNNIEFLNEDGTTESWSDISRESFLETAKNDLQEIKKSLILCDESISMLETQLNEAETSSTVS